MCVHYVIYARAVTPNLTLHISHLRLVHSSDQFFSVVCGVRGCRETFGAFAAFNSHVYRHHRNALGLEIFPDSCDMTTRAGSSFCEEDISSSILPVNTFIDNEHDTVADAPAVQMSDSGPISQTTRAAKFLLHLREGRRVSQVALTDMIDMCNVMCTHIVDDLKQEIREKCAQVNVSIEGLEDALSRSPPHPFEGVETIYKLKTFCVDHFG